MNIGITKKFILQIYLLVSITIIIGFVFLNALFIYPGGSDGDIVSNVMSNVLQFLMIPAIYGLFTIRLLRKNDNNYISAIKYFGGAAALGIVSIIFDWIWLYLQHIDCGNSCVSSILTYSQSWICILILLFPLVVSPALIIRKLKQPGY